MLPTDAQVRSTLGNAHVFAFSQFPDSLPYSDEEDVCHAPIIGVVIYTLRQVYLTA